MPYSADANAPPASPDDCETGADAPNIRNEAITIPPQICSGYLPSGDKGDFFHFKVGGSTFRIKTTLDSGVSACYYFSNFQMCNVGDVQCNGCGDMTVGFSGAGGYNMSVSIGGNRAPTIDLLECSPVPATAGEPTTCSFKARDDSTGVRYELDWGDGSVATIPHNGFVWQNRVQQVTHTYAAPGDYSIRLRAVDNGLPNGPSMNSELTSWMRVREVGALETVMTKPYTAGTGDLLCVDRIGCTVFQAALGETAVTLRIVDQHNRNVAATVCITDCSNGNYLEFCGETTIAIPSDAPTLRVFLAEGFAPLMCAPLSSATVGTVTATLR